MLQARLRQAWTGSLRVAACAALGAVLLIGHGGGHAFAQDDDDDDDLSFEQKFIRNLMGGIGMAGTGAGIEYRERSPLVIPPGRDLPPPEADVSRPATNWPNDPEKRRKIAKKKAKPLDARETKLWDDPGRPLSPGELNVGRTSGGTSTATTTAPGTSASQTEGGNPVLPSVLGYTGGVFGTLWGNNTKEETATFTGEPPRTSLTAPPTGYMTPSPAQPYGIGTQRVQQKPVNPGDLPARTTN